MTKKEKEKFKKFADETKRDIFVLKSKEILSTAEFYLLNRLEKLTNLLAS